MFVYALCAGPYDSFFRDGRSFAKWFIIGFGGGLIGWGLPMMVGLHFGLSDCEIEKLVVGRLTKCISP